MPCKHCIKDAPNWVENLKSGGRAPVCAFDGAFNANWNCGTLNSIRDICYEGQELPPGVAYQYCDDQKYATIKIDECQDAAGQHIGMTLWVAWYKSRGRTDAMWILDSSGTPRTPTEAELTIIIDFYKAQKALKAPKPVLPSRR